jgi:hypothetical protein
MALLCGPSRSFADKQEWTGERTGAPRSPKRKWAEEDGRPGFPVTRLRPMATYAAFIEESRMQFGEATNLDRKFGGRPTIAFSFELGSWSGESAFHHHRGHRQAAGVGEGKGNCFYPEFPGQQGGPSAQFKHGPPSRLTLNLELSPCDSAADAGSQRFRSRLFGGKTCGEAFCTRSLTAAAIGDLMIGVNAAQKAFAVAFDRVRDALDLDQIHACANQHAEHITMGSFPVISTFPECNRNHELWYLFCG